MQRRPMNPQSNVYIVQLTDEPRLKIGKADTLSTRLGRLDLLTAFDPSRSWQIRCPAKEAEPLEKLLQARMDSYHIPDLPFADGYTEWFRSDGYRKLVAHIHKWTAALEYTLEPLTVITPSAKAKPLIQKSRPARMFLSLQPLRPWIKITKQFPHTLCYATDEYGDLHIYLDAQDQDALNVVACFTDIDNGGYPSNIYHSHGIEEPFIRYRAGGAAASRIFFGEYSIHPKEEGPPRLRAKFKISAGRLRHYTTKHPGLRRMRNWILQQADRAEIRRIALRPAGKSLLSDLHDPNY